MAPLRSLLACRSTAASIGVERSDRPCCTRGQRDPSALVARLLRGRAPFRLGIALVLLGAAVPAGAQISRYGLRFHGTGADQQDRVRIPIDDDLPGPTGSAPCDVGAGDFTLELWLRGTPEDNPTVGLGGDLLLAGELWREGNVLLDRDLLNVSGRDFGVSVAGGLVRFGTGGGDGGTELPVTLEGSEVVLDGTWHHVACVREAATGTLRIYVDGALDHASPPGTSSADLSYPDQGLPTHGSPWDPFLVLGAEKHDSGPAQPSYAGYLDELRIWNTARSAEELAISWFLLLPGDTPGLVASYRFEEGQGTLVLDASAAGSPAGELIAGSPGNGEWVRAADDPANTAPIVLSSLPPGFQLTTLTTELDHPTALAVPPDGRLFIANLAGRVLVMKDDQLLPDPLVEIPAGTMGERGLQDLELDPDFANNGFLYVYYSTSEPRNRVGRFTVVGDAADLASELVVWENTEPSELETHHGGGLAFAPEGHLFIATGDLEIHESSQDLSNEHGKLLRVHPDGSIPADNPYVDDPAAVPTIFARGLRNPFRISVDPREGTLWIGDVGGNGALRWEEVDRGEAEANYGWPAQEGEDCFVSDCSSFAPPVFAYRHDDEEFLWSAHQAAVILGPVYRHTAFPPEYRNSLYIGDYANRWIRRLEVEDHGDGHGQHLGEPQLFMKAPDSGPIGDLAVGPAGELYFLSYGPAGGPALGAAGAVYRIEYLVDGNHPPVVAAAADPTSGGAPLGVSFSSAGTFDPDGDPSALSYLWDFGDDRQSSEPDPLHTYDRAGLYIATLRVDDGAASAVSEPLEISVGTPPVTAIDTPREGTEYRAGDTIDFAGSATDAEDGDLDPTALSWLVQLVHAGHVHPFLGPIEGVAQGSFEIPTEGHPPEETHFRLRLSATDSDGLSSDTVRDLIPVLAPVELRTRPKGVSLLVAGQGESTPRVYASLPGYVLTVEAPRAAVADGRLWLFDHWSDGGARVHDYVTPEGGGALEAVFLPALQMEVEAQPEARERNAQFSPPWGQTHADQDDPEALCVGRKSDGVREAGIEFPLPVPQGAYVVSAALEVYAADDQQGDATVDLWAYDVADAPLFLEGAATPIDQWAPLTAARIRWRPVPDFTPGLVYATPDLAALVQEVIDRPDWLSGNALGLVLDGQPTDDEAWRCARNFDSGDPPTLIVHYAVPAPYAGR